MSGSQQIARHPRAHFPESNETDLHRNPGYRVRRQTATELLREVRKLVNALRSTPHSVTTERFVSEPSVLLLRICVAPFQRIHLPSLQRFQRSKSLLLCLYETLFPTSRVIARRRLVLRVLRQSPSIRSLLL